MNITITPDQIRKLKALLQESSTPVSIEEMIAALRNG